MDLLVSFNKETALAKMAGTEVPSIKDLLKEISSITEVEETGSGYLAEIKADVESVQELSDLLDKRLNVEKIRLISFDI